MKLLFTRISMSCLFVLLSLFATGQNFTISGYIKDNTSGEVLIGANVYEKSSLKGTTSNHFGYFSLTLPKDSLEIVFSFVGYQPVIKKVFLDKNLEVTINLTDALALEEIVITGEEAIQEVTQMSKINVPIEQIKSMPAFLGEVDVLKVLQLLPGVQSGTEGSSGLYVRGGSPDQNLILLDGVPVYNASHLFGFFSVFNADAINKVDLIKGGFPARYGGRLSSVIDITMKEGNKEKLKGEGSIGLISSKLTLHGPIKNENTTFLISGRRTYIDFLARPIIKASTEGDETAGYYFYDVNAKINHKFTNKDRIFLSTYFGNDKAYSRYKDEYTSGNQQLTYEDEFDLNWGNIITAFRWNHVFTPKFFSNLTLTYSRYRFRVGEEYKDQVLMGTEVVEEEEAIEYFSGIRDFGAKMDFEFIPNPDHYVRMGVNAIHHTFSPGILSFQSTNDADTTIGSFDTKAVETAAYIEDDIKIGSRLKINAGLHYSTLFVDEEIYHSLQPRLALRYLLPDGTSVKASYVQMTQYIHLLTNSGIGLPTDLWLPATSRVGPQDSFQFAIGAAKTLNNGLEVSLEGYYKEMEGLIEYKEGASFLSVEGDWQDKVEIGRGESYGGELLIQKKTGKFTGWVGYTLSWTNRQFDNLNFGEKFPYKYDRRHDISVTGVYKLNDKVTFSGAWIYGTGNAVSLPQFKYLKNGRLPVGGDNYFGNNIIEGYGERNSFRMKAYHRLDLSVAFSKQKKRGVRTWTVGTYNTYSRQNPFFIDIRRQFSGEEKFVQYSLFPIIPSISYSFKF